MAGVRKGLAMVTSGAAGKVVLTGDTDVGSRNRSRAVRGG
jgi:hypothetical protein